MGFGRPELKSTHLLEIKALTVEFPMDQGVLRAVDEVSLSLARGESLGLVGESGCGKSVMAQSILGLLPPPGRVRAGEILFDGMDLVKLSPPELRKVRGRRIGIVFQEPMRSLNPVLRCGEQVAEVLRAHRGVRGGEARAQVCAIFEQMGFHDGGDLYDAYPHQLSGGMRQRVMIAVALACDPCVLLADEPTTALDVTIQAQIISLLARLKRARNLSVLFISHNLALVSEACERVAVMYAGRIVEVAPVAGLFDKPWHPYTRALIACLPGVDDATRPTPIPGEVPHPLALPGGCRFRDRCPEARAACGKEPPLVEGEAGHWVRCWVAQEAVGRNHDAE
ncbi:MAG: ABC transporter ATP-binding protein [Candidatus Eisenbacteria sp.]|nr:ABC transporter ATP-binding protein [Candidatus Eisenbacteria bacterium]